MSLAPLSLSNYINEHLNSLLFKRSQTLLCLRRQLNSPSLWHTYDNIPTNLITPEHIFIGSAIRWIRIAHGLKHRHSLHSQWNACVRSLQSKRLLGKTLQLLVSFEKMKVASYSSIRIRIGLKTTGFTIASSIILWFNLQWARNVGGVIVRKLRKWRLSNIVRKCKSV